MNKIRPVKPEHSIKEVVFVLKLSKQLSVESLQVLKQLEDSIKSELPIMEPQEATSFVVKPGNQISVQPPRLASLAFKNSTENNGQFDWMLRAESDFIAVNCLNYTRWKEVWPKARNYLSLASNKLASTENPIVSIALQYLDQFIYEEKKEFKTSIVFNDDSDFLSGIVSKAGPLWHTYQGWFGNKNEQPILHSLNITAAMAGKEHHTTIDHRGTIQFKNKTTNHKTLFNEIKNKTAADHYFDLLHEENKQILKDLLNKERIKDIKLN